jgi:hypothetical protein
MTNRVKKIISPLRSEVWRYRVGRTNGVGDGGRGLPLVRQNITERTEFDGVDGIDSGGGVGNGVSPNKRKV